MGVAAGESHTDQGKYRELPDSKTISKAPSSESLASEHEEGNGDAQTAVIGKVRLSCRLDFHDFIPQNFIFGLKGASTL